MRALPRLLAGVCVGVTVAAETGAVVLTWGLEPAYKSVLFGLYDVTIVVIGALIAVRHPRNPIGWILAGFGVQTAVLADLTEAYGQRAASAGWVGGPAAEWLGFGDWSTAPLMWVLALLFIPTGRLPGPRWRWVAWAGCAGALLFIPGWLLDPRNGSDFVSGTNPYAIPGAPPGLLTTVGGALLTVAAAGSLASVVVRYRAAAAAERLQLKWVALAGVLVVLLLPVCILFWSRSAVVQAATPVVLIVAALCLAAAVLRYRLFDVDVIVNRTIAYLALSVLLAGAYGGTAIVLGSVLGGQSSWTTAGATLVAAMAFRPLRRAVQAEVDRRFDRDKHDASVRIDRFLERLRAGIEQPERVEDLLRHVLRDPTLRVLLLLPATQRYSDVQGKPAKADPSRPTVRLERSGTADVLVEYTATDDPAAEHAVRAAVERSRLALEIARLGVGLNRQLAELDRSRGRIASAADEERRRIQRDLHDGAQQRLVTVGLALRATESRLRSQGRHLEADRLDSAVAELAVTIEELRNLAGRLPLAQLDGGIEAAFRELAERAPLPVHVEVPAQRLDRHLEMTAYFVGCEGLTNVIKHAQASSAVLQAERRDRCLVVTVADDGIGGALARPGSGLDGLADRVHAAGGRLLLDSGATGTVLSAELPCA